MAKKSLGYVQLQWTCPNCGTKNPGPQKICSNCGGPQPDDVEFEQMAQEELITDEAKLAEAKVGPDIHCYYCGTRNAADAETCTQCGASLVEGTARQRGRVVGAHRHGPAEKIICPACGTPNEADAPQCVQCGASLVQPDLEPAPSPAAPVKAKRSPGLSGFWGGAGLVVLVLLVCAAIITFFVLSRRTEDVSGTVQGVNWTRTLAIEGLVPVTYEEWRDEIPAEAVIGSCTQEVHHTQNNPAPNSEEVCGTPYTVDTGSGFGEVVQDCEYRVYEAFCEYTLEEWQEVDQATLNGSNFNPQWPNVSLGVDKREGERSESYRVEFSTEEGRYSYSPRNQAEFNQYQIGSRWLLKVNTFNAVVSTEPGG